jgi:hypothetical protein
MMKEYEIACRKAFPMKIKNLILAFSIEQKSKMILFYFYYLILKINSVKLKVKEIKKRFL